MDYSNPRICDFVNVENNMNELISRVHDPRMPWHDVGMSATGDICRDVARHFTQVWNYVKRDKAKSNEDVPILHALSQSRARGTAQKIKAAVMSRMTRHNDGEGEPKKRR